MCFIFTWYIFYTIPIDIFCPSHEPRQMTIKKNKQQLPIFHQRKSDMLATILNLIEITSNTIFFLLWLFKQLHLSKTRIFCIVFLV